MMKFGFRSSLLGAVMMGATTLTAMAGEPLTVQNDKTQLITVSTEPGTVVIGNPSIADVSINGKQIFIHGHSIGDTNLMILDTSGNQIANFELTVASSNTNAVAIFKAGTRYSYTCAPLCDVTMQVGDSFDHTENVIKMNVKKTEYATGKKSAESAAPAAPQ